MGDTPLNRLWQRLEREFYYNQKEAKRLGEVRKQVEEMPRQRQCHRYRWTQTETKFDVEIPMLKACEDKDLYLIVDKDQMQVAIKTDESFGAITVSLRTEGTCLPASISASW